MSGETQTRSKAEEKAKAGIKTYVKALGVLISPVLIWLLQDFYVTMKDTNRQLAVLQTELSEVREREIDNMWKFLYQANQDLTELKVQVRINQQLAEIAIADWAEDIDEEPAMTEFDEEDWAKELQQELLDELRESRDYEEEFQQQQQMQQKR